MQVRTYYEGFRLAAATFFDNLLPKLVDLQFTRGGPIIAVQVSAGGRGRGGLVGNERGGRRKARNIGKVRGRWG